MIITESALSYNARGGTPQDDGLFKKDFLPFFFKSRTMPLGRRGPVSDEERETKRRRRKKTTHLSKAKH